MSIRVWERFCNPFMTSDAPKPIAIFIATALALIAFAANSVFCRLALGTGAIDANHFTEIRLFSGAFVLWIICKTGSRKKVKPAESGWLSPLYLFVYAFTFSLAYVTLNTGTGALILFAAVQMTMVAVNLLRGHTMGKGEWSGMVIAFGGFIYLILPGVSTPPLNGFLLMTVSGIAWGLYTLRGQSSTDPLVDTGRNFMRTLVFVMLLALITYRQGSMNTTGTILAVLSGGLASGVGYTIWYFALRGLRTTSAAVAQLSVPVLAAIGGVLFMDEAISLRLAVASLLILGGIRIVVTRRNPAGAANPGQPAAGK